MRSRIGAATILLKTGVKIVGKVNNVVELGEAKAGETFRILFESSNLYKIDYHGKDGYVLKSACRKIWLAKQ